MQRAALAYAERLGIAVHPIARSKAPLSPHGFQDATTDPAQIRKWWTLHPDANIGVRCDRFFVVDVDPKNDGHRTLDGWLSMHGSFPTTWTARTGSGGLHVYFQHDPSLDEIPLGALKRTGIDIKGSGRHYVLAPPSVSSKGAYQWITRPSAVPLAKPPAWLLRTIHRMKAAPPVVHSEPVDVSRYSGMERVELARRYADERVPVAISGSYGHDVTMSAAVKVARGFALTEDEALAALSDWNRACQPPWPEHLLRRKIKHALDVGKLPMGCLLERRRNAA